MFLQLIYSKNQESLTRGVLVFILHLNELSVQDSSWALFSIRLFIFTTKFRVKKLNYAINYEIKTGRKHEIHKRRRTERNKTTSRNHPEKSGKKDNKNPDDNCMPYFNRAFRLDRRVFRFKGLRNTFRIRSIYSFYRNRRIHTCRSFRFCFGRCRNTFDYAQEGFE